MAKTETSSTQICSRLDLKRVGFIRSPSMVPICPDDGFVLYKAAFSQSEITLLRPWVESDEFKLLAKTETPYFRIARTQEKLAAPNGVVALSYVAATWEAGDGDRYRRYAGVALEKLAARIQQQGVNAADEKALSRSMATLLVAELQRRLGKFEDAHKALHSLPAEADAAMRDVAAYEEELIEKRDSAPHYLPRVKEEQCASLDGPAAVSVPGVVVTPEPVPTRKALPAELLRH